MKKIISFILVGFFILGGLTAVSGNENLVNNKIIESIDTEIHIAPITIPNPQGYNTFNGNRDQTIDELKVFTVSYKQHLNNIDVNKKINEQLKPKEMMNKFGTYDYVIITTENLYNAITSSTFLGWKTLIGFKIKIVNITDTEIASQTGEVEIYLKKLETF